MRIETLIGQAAGGALIIFIFSQLLEMAIFMRVFDDPLAGKLTAVLCGFLCAMALYVLVLGQPFVDGMLAYGLGAVIVALFAHRRAMQLRRQMLEESEPELEETFR